MGQLNAEQAKAKLLEVLPSRTVYWAVLHQGFWYLCATDKNDPDEGELNPYFKVHETSGEVSEFYVVQDIPLFQKIVAQVGTTS